jgi:CxC ATPase-based modification system component
MNLDQKIVQAIKEAVEEAGQSPALARRLIAWMEAVTSGNEDPADQTAAARHLEILYAETAAAGASEEDY